MILRILTAVWLSSSFLVSTTLGAPKPEPQRSIQLGEGPRPVAIHNSIYSQQLAFGPPQAQPQPILHQPTPSSPLSQQLLQQQPGRIRIPQGLQQPQPQQILPHTRPQPIVLQQGTLSSSQPKPFSLQPFPGIGVGPTTSAAAGRPVIPLRSPVASIPQTQDEEEYEDEEYEEEAPARPVPQARPVTPLRLAPSPTPSPRPIIQQTPTQRVQQIRITPQPQQLQQLLSQVQPQTVPGPGPQRFVVPQQAVQPQPTPQQIRRPVKQQQRIIPTAAPAPVQYQPQVSQITRQQAVQQQSKGQQRQQSTPPPIQTLDRYMRQNGDGSITWGYTNEDGTFKEETIGVDCVVRGKYGYVDPDGQKREYEYQQGNPCDPNKTNQPEDEELEEEVVQGPSPNQKLGGLITASPRQPLPRRLIQQQQQPIYQQ